MPYSFVEIEKQKKWIIRAIFIFLIILYFLAAELLWLITKLFFLFRFEFETIKFPALFSLRESIGVFFIASIAALIHWYFSTRNMISKILNLFAVTEPDPKDSYHQVLKNIIEEVCVATGGIKIIGYVAPLMALNAFAISDAQGNAVIGVTEGLLAKLNRSQLESVIAHEAAHIASGDSLSTTIACSLFGVYSALLNKISRVLSSSRDTRERRGGMIVYLIVVYIVLSVAQFISLLLNMFLSRQKELMADAIAVRLTRNPISLSEALYIISRGWRGVGGIPDSLSPIFIMSPDYHNLEETEGFISDLFSTHPPVSRRLSVLLDMAHSDIALLKAGIKEKVKIPVQQGIIEFKEEQNKQWFIYKDAQWQGPLGIQELFNFGLSPDSWVSKLSEDFIKPASEDEDLQQALRNRLTGNAIIEAQNCPECKQPLGELLYEGAPILKCYYCNGIFTSSNVILRIISREDFAFDASIQQTAEALLKPYSKGISQEYFKVVYKLNCPKCGEKMWRGFFSSAYPIEIDRCEKCNYVWFNKDELEILQYLSEKFRQSG